MGKFHIFILSMSSYLHGFHRASVDFSNQIIETSYEEVHFRKIEIRILSHEQCWKILDPTIKTLVFFLYFYRIILKGLKKLVKLYLFTLTGQLA